MSNSYSRYAFDNIYRFDAYLQHHWDIATHSCSQCHCNTTNKKMHIIQPYGESQMQGLAQCHFYYRAQGPRRKCQKQLQLKKLMRGSQGYVTCIEICQMSLSWTKTPPTAQAMMSTQTSAKVAVEPATKASVSSRTAEDLWYRLQTLDLGLPCRNGASVSCA